MDKIRKSIKDKSKLKKKSQKQKSQKYSQFFQIIETEEFYNKGFLIRKKIKNVIPIIQTRIETEILNK